MTWVPIFDAAGSQFPTNPQACWDDGFRAIAGYVNQGSWKSFTPAMKAKWLTSAHPFGFAPMYEVKGTEPVLSPTVGSAHALAARKGARALGIPDDVAIAYAMDTNVSMTQVKGPIAKYFELVGKYDTALPIAYIENDGAEWLAAQGLIAGGFIPAAYSWNNPPVLITPANAASSALWTQEHNGRPIHGGTVDVGNIRTTAPIWWPSSSAGSAPITGDDDMATVVTVPAGYSNAGKQVDAGTALTMLLSMQLDTRNRVIKAAASADPKALAAELAPLLPAGELSQAEIEAALRNVFADAAS
jgi:hypothetical protein